VLLVLPNPPNPVEVVLLLLFPPNEKPPPPKDMLAAVNCSRFAALVKIRVYRAGPCLRMRKVEEKNQGSRCCAIEVLKDEDKLEKVVIVTRCRAPSDTVAQDNAGVA
jgi:hypothetical protein